MRTRETELFINGINGLYANKDILNFTHRSNLTSVRDETLKELVFKASDEAVTTLLTNDPKGFFQPIRDLPGMNIAQVNAKDVQEAAFKTQVCLKLHQVTPDTLQKILQSTNEDSLFAALTRDDAKRIFGDYATNEARIKTLMSPAIIESIKQQATHAVLVNNTNTLAGIENALNTNLPPIAKSNLALRHFKLKTAEITEASITEQHFNNPIRFSIYQYSQDLLGTDIVSAETHVAQHFLTLYTEKYAHLHPESIKEAINAANLTEFKNKLTNFTDNTFHKNQPNDGNKVLFSNYINKDQELIALKQSMVKGFIQTIFTRGTEAEILTLKNSAQNATTLVNTLNTMGVNQATFMTTEPFKTEILSYTKKAVDDLEKRNNTHKLITLLNANTYAHQNANAHTALQTVFNSLSIQEQIAALAKFDSDPLALPRLLQAETPEAIKYFLQIENKSTIAENAFQPLVLENQKSKSLVHLKNYALAKIFAELSNDYALTPEQATRLTTSIYNNINLAAFNNGLGDPQFLNSFNAILAHVPQDVRNTLWGKIGDPFSLHLTDIKREKDNNIPLFNLSQGPANILHINLIDYLQSLHKTTPLTTNHFETIRFAFTHAKTLEEFKKSLSAQVEYDKLPALNRPAFAQPEADLFKNMTEGEFQTVKNQTRSAYLSDGANYNTIFQEESGKMRQLANKLDTLRREYDSLDFKDLPNKVDNLLNPAFVTQATAVAVKEGYKTLAEYTANQVLFLEKKKNDLTQYQNELNALLTLGPDANKRHAIQAQLTQIQGLKNQIDTQLNKITPLHNALSKPENPDESIIARIEKQGKDTQSSYLTLNKTYGYQHTTRVITGKAADHKYNPIHGSYNPNVENRIDIGNQNRLEEERLYKNEEPLKAGQFYVHTIDCGANKPVAEITEEIHPNKMSYRVSVAMQDRDTQFKQAHQMVLIHLARFAAEPNKEDFKITVGPHSNNQLIADMMVLYKKLGPAVGFKMNKVEFVGYNPTKETSWGSYTGFAKKAEEALNEFTQDGNKNLLLKDSQAGLKQIIQDKKESPVESEKLSKRFKELNDAIRNSDQADILEEKNVHYSAPKPR